MKLFKNISTWVRSFQLIKADHNNVYIFINVALIAFELFYLLYRFSYINPQVPFWYVMPWGDLQITGKKHLFLFPLLSGGIFTLGVFMAAYAQKYFFRYGSEMIRFIVVFANAVLAYSLFRIIFLASKPFDPIIPPLYLNLFLIGAIAFLIVYFLTPLFIDFAKSKRIITSPLAHIHPGMVLTRPSARAGGVVFMAGFLATSLVFVRPTPEIIAIYVAALLLVILGFLDDYQNTHPKSQFSFLEKPYLRLISLFLIVSILVASGITINFVGNPLGGFLFLDAFNFAVLGKSLAPIAMVITVIWVVWVLNLLSWSNGIDGQYSGIIGIAGIITAFLTLRFVPLQETHLNLARMAIILSGASLGLLPYNWHPSRIMWGFGAMGAGLILSAISILGGTKIVTSIMVILIPFMDALVTVIRRIALKKNPLKGDKGHLHHLLLERGWSTRKIAVFYWTATLFFGIVGLLSSESNLLQIFLIVAGVVAFIILLLNLERASHNNHANSNN